ncbi:MAG: class B sortase [Bacilli bacterium]|nr:class B sortase [Bacilli bacterium]
MKKIKFTINDDTLFIGYKIENNTFRNLSNTNIISKDDLIFDLKYYRNNISLIAGFLNVMLKTDNVTHAIIEQEELILSSLELLNHLPSITELVIKPDIAIDFDTHLAILKNDTLKVINCYTIPTYLLERIDTTKSVKIETRNEVFFISNFLRKNRLTSYSDVFYKRKILIDYDLQDIDFKDLDQFLSINTYLKTIYFEYINLDLIKNVIRFLRENKKKNISIEIKGTPNNLSYFNALEEYVKKSKYIKKNKISFKIDYTRDYKLDNFLKLLNFASLKYILVVIIISCLLGYGINQYDLYKSSVQIDAITDDIADLLEEFEHLDSEDTIPDQNTETPEPTPPTTTPAPPPSNYVSPYYKNYAKVISVLKETNRDTVGWVTVNNTTVNYPVVQSTNNSYYLNHDFNKHSNSLGWIFMDYRNNATDLDQNTVIYGHNIAKDKLMFGNLSATLNPNWYTKASNQYITFNTSSKDMQWRIFSIYKIAATNDYLYNTFETQEDFLTFANKIKSRSIYDFGVEIKENDKLLTLSTCQNSGKSRLVVHAVLVQ